MERLMCRLLIILSWMCYIDACSNNNECSSGGFCALIDQKFDCTCRKKCHCYDCLIGDKCDELVASPTCDQCMATPSPCPNDNFSCSPRLGGFSCDCIAGRTGYNCEFKIDSPCASYPCLHGGSCEESNSAYRCRCPPEYSGVQCQHVINGACADVSCENGGRCTTILEGTRGVCTCPNEWKGTRCEQPVSANDPSTHCTANSCGTASQGYCQEIEGGFQCLCAPGRNGDRCENEDAPCRTMDCQNSGLCLETEDKSAARCICTRGYSGEKCQDKDSCWLAPCKNGGNCSNTATTIGFSCECTTDWYGNTCEEFNACSTQPCMHGTCEPMGEGRYQCSCDAGWKGEDCDEDINECSLSGDAPCENNGTCVNTQGSFECSCINGTHGFNCSINPDDCDMNYRHEGHNYSNLCIVKDENATCHDGFNDYTCTCSPGYTGYRCWDDINECELGEVLCEYEGTCVNTFGSFYCICRTGTFGFNCSIKPDECKINPVIVGGKMHDNFCVAKDSGANCTDDFGTYSCVCSERWTGKYCMEDVDECSFNPTPCKHYSTCVNTPGLYQCLCIEGTEGQDCEINPNDCENVTMCNSVDKIANCTDGFAKWWCTCGPDYTGQFCDLEMIIYEILQSLGGGTTNETDLISMLQDLLHNPSKMKDLIPFILGLESIDNRTEMSWTVDDQFLWVAYEEKTLNLDVDLYKWNDVVLGNCFTFNHFNNSERMYKMRSAGAQGGLKAAIKLNSNEYLHITETVGIMTFIHPNTETIFSESPRYNAEPGAETTIQTMESRYVRLGGRYGKCVKSASEVTSYYYEGTYTTDGCLRSCYQDAVKAECGCMDSRYPFPDDEHPCEISHRKCVDAIIAKGDVAKWGECICPLPCENSQFDTSYTKAPFVRNRNRCNSYNGEQRLNDSACSNGQLDPDFAIINVQVPRLTVQIFVETPSWTGNKLVGNIGGLGGVVCGLNMITFFEFGFFFFYQLPMAMYNYRRQ